MFKPLITLMAGAAIAVTSFSPASAMPRLPQQPAVTQQSDAPVVNVRHRRGFWVNNGRGYYNGHRGYRRHHHGYRYHNGYWFPPAAFAIGAIIGGAVANQNRVRSGRVGPRHVRWCYDRYRSYREYDNSFQPYNGPRRQCRSPYW
ncbi:BA14K family protein [Pseudohoeflea suaedae]|uniref:Lectin-like protein BA14k n=1 Tax=Pseudohoeflea suaedae TaxID=877384 RepID=A0A4R5PP90_9HYPH|nr:BA14K family protein [Pseudohoeflea suaedae]TDH38471.1 BA14K family protein [Pseudohoeflea suaedae]